MNLPKMKGALALLALLLSDSTLADIRDIGKQGQWKIFQVDAGGTASSPAIAIGPSNETYLSYISDGRVKCRSNRLGFWVTDTIAVADVPGEWGIDQDVTVDRNGHAHVVFLHRDGTVFNVKYATDASGTWTLPVQLFQSSRGCWTPSVAVGSDGEIRIVLIETSGNAKPSWLIYIHGTPGYWAIDTIAYGASDCSALALDQNNNAHVAYYSGGRVNYLTNAPDGIWQAIENFDWLGGQLEAMKLDIAVDSAGQPHVSYVGQALEDNKYAVKSGGSWETVTLDSGGFSSAGNAIALDRSGHAHICYYHKRSGLIKYASNVSGNWVSDTICAGSWMTIPVSIAVDNRAYPHVCTDDNVYATTAPLPGISIRPAHVDFGPVRLGATKVDSVHLVNTGDADATVVQMSLSGVNAGDFRFMCTCDTIVPGDSCIVGVIFTPHTTGQREARLKVCSNALSTSEVLLDGEGWTEYSSWVQTIGSSYKRSEHGTSVEQTRDGGYIVAGAVQTGEFQEDCDVWVLKLDSSGSITWQNRLGGGGYDYARESRQTDDGGYIIIGETKSFPQAGFDPDAAWLVKLDSLGTADWQRQYMGTERHDGWWVQQTADRGYFVGDTKGLLIKVDSVGLPQWQREFSALMESASLTANGGFILSLRADGLPTEDPLHGTAWFIRLTEAGTIEWQKYYYPGHAPYSIIKQALDGGFIAWINTWPGTVIIKLDSAGTPVWSKKLDGEWATVGWPPREIGLTADSGFVLFWEHSILKISKSGNCEWQSRTPRNSRMLKGRLATDGGFLVTGIWQYFDNPDDQFPKGVDLWVGRLDSSGLVSGCDVLTRGESVSATDVPPGLINSSFVLQDGSLQTVQTDGSTHAMAADATYRCAFDPRLVDSDGDGIPNLEEMGPEGTDAGYDGNADGLADAQQNNVASFLFLNGKYGTLAADSGTVLEDVFVYPVVFGYPEAPDSVSILYDLLGFRITGLAVGDTVAATLFLPDGESFDSYYKYGATFENQTPHWYEFAFDGMTGAELKGSVITLHFVDGMRGDDDLSANGTILEPGGPARLTAVDVRGHPDGSLPTVYKISQNYPNPFNPTTLIRYELPEVSNVKLAVYDLLGREVAMLVNERKAPGRYTVTFDARNNASGMYFCRMTAGSCVQTRKMLLLR